MPALREIERSFVDAIRDGDATTLAAHVAPLALSAERRIQIYRNHFTISLTEALSATYPTLKALVGEAFFDQTARRFAAEQPPSSPVLFEYGAAFPTFMAEATRSPEYRYLSDVGAFEWAINHAYHADDAPPFDPSTLLTVPEARRGDVVFDLHPSAQVFVSEYPTLDIWRANRPDADAGRTIDLDAGGVRLLVWRHGIDVVWQPLSAADATLIVALLNRHAFADACAAALTEDPLFQPAPMLADLMAGGVIAGFTLSTPDLER